MIKQICSISYPRIVILAQAFLFLFCLSYLTGCGPTLSSTDKINEFEKAGPVTSEVVINASGKPETRLGPYRIVSGDLLELQIPPIVRIISSDVSSLVQAELDRTRSEPYSCRVNDDGNIALPIVGEMPVAGKTVAEAEAMIVNAYYPKYVVNVPMVVCKVAKYKNENERVFTIMGLVRRPDTYPYPPDVQYNLTEALGFAGGINMIADPQHVTIYRQSLNGEIVSVTFRIDGKSRSDAYDVIIKPGDVICVDQTLRTRTNEFIAGIFHVGVGAQVDMYNR
jgi:protein involved in polysaccharide export with SLBB domain